MRDPGGQLAMGRLQVLDQLSLVLVHLLLEPLYERGAVAGVSGTHGSLKEQFSILALHFLIQPQFSPAGAIETGRRHYE